MIYDKGDEATIQRFKGSDMENRTYKLVSQTSLTVASIEYSSWLSNHKRRYNIPSIVPHTNLNTQITFKRNK